MRKLFVGLLLFIMSVSLYAQDKKQESPAPTLSETATEKPEEKSDKTKPAQSDSGARKDTAELLQEVEELEKTVEELKKKSKYTSLDVEDLEVRVDDAEKAFGANKLDFKMDFRFTVNNFFYKDNSSENKDLGTLQSDGEMYNSMNLRGRLNFMGNLGNKFKLTGWLTMYKKVLQSAPDAYNNEEILPAFDLARAHYPSDSRVYMERLYIDWFPADWLALTLGRGGFSDGVPADMRYDTVSLGFVPETALNITADAIYITLKMEPLIGLKGTFVRLSWTPIAYQHDYTGHNLFEKYENFDNANNYAVNIDMPVPGIARSRFKYLMYYNDSFNVITEFPENPLGLTGKLRSYGSLGGMLLNNFTFTFDHIFDSPFDLCFSTNISTSIFIRRDGKNKGFLAVDDTDDEYVQPLITMLGNDLTGGTATGYMLYAGFRYHTPLKIYNKAVKIGGEFMYSTKNHVSFTTPDTTELFRYGVRGYNAEGFITIPAHNSANIRLGYIYQQHNYATGLAFFAGAGIPEVDETIHNIHMMFNVYFD